MSKDIALGEGWIDVTRPVTADMVHWPGDPEVVVVKVQDISKGDICNVTTMSMCVHTGTHMDAPSHYLHAGDNMETLPLSAVIGKARVIAIDDPVSIRRSELEKHSIKAGERIFFKTCNVSIKWNTPFQMDFVYIAEDAAKYLAELRVALVGVDYMSVGGFYQDMVETHVALMKGDVWIVENVDLTDIGPGEYEVLCLPMKIVGSDGAPARVLMRPL